MHVEDLAGQYPHLFSEVVWPWEPARAIFTLLSEHPPDNLVANVNLVPRIGNTWVSIRLADGLWEIPCGTLEPGETYQAAIQRELMEEVGAQLVSSAIIGAWKCTSLADRPYRPYLPFPNYYRLVLYGEIQLVGQPANPRAGERVVSVERASLERVVNHFISQSRYDLAELYNLASRLHP